MRHSALLHEIPHGGPNQRAVALRVQGQQQHWKPQAGGSGIVQAHLWPHGPDQLGHILAALCHVGSRLGGAQLEPVRRVGPQAAAAAGAGFLARCAAPRGLWQPT